MPAIGPLAIMMLAAALLIAGQQARAAELHGKVVGVSDGDTITVLDAARATHRVRLNGIDAPEKGQPFGMRAKERLASLAFGQPVTVIWNKRDRYGRIVGEVRIACSVPGCTYPTDAGLALIEAGLAWHFKRYQNEQSPEDRMRYARAEDSARLQRLRLWRDAQPVAPWDYRRQHRADNARVPSSAPLN
jgi:endonuclease YncB( thermonuclease family)